MTAKLIQFIIVLLICLHSACAAVDCKKYPKFNSNEATNCCKVPDPKWNSFPLECAKYMTALGRPASPCAYECVFNTTNTFQNGKIIAANLRPFLSKIFDDKIFLETYMIGFQKCSTILGAEKSIKPKSQRTNGRSSSRKKSSKQLICSPLALRYTMCAHTHTFVNCPSTAWTASAICEDAKEYAKNCHKSYGYRGEKD